MCENFTEIGDASFVQLQFPKIKTNNNTVFSLTLLFVTYYGHTSVKFNLLNVAIECCQRKFPQHRLTFTKVLLICKEWEKLWEASEDSQTKPCAIKGKSVANTFCHSFVTFASWSKVSVNCISLFFRLRSCSSVETRRFDFSGSVTDSINLGTRVLINRAACCAGVLLVEKKRSTTSNSFFSANYYF